MTRPKNVCAGGYIGSNYKRLATLPLWSHLNQFESGIKNNYRNSYEPMLLPFLLTGQCRQADVSLRHGSGNFIKH